MKRFLKSNWFLSLSFLLPFVIMACYFAYRNMAPFGSQSILTVDMGQQYVDFYAYFKHAITSDPSSIFYSFSKALGGEMIGLWAYYLTSPINLILLLFPLRSLASGILIMTLIKYGLAGLSFGYLLFKRTKTNLALIPAWATMYALNGWIIANQLNLIWLDAMYMLPLVVLGIERLVDTGRIRTYLISLAMMLFINYYMAYMVCIFSVIYFAYYATTQYRSKRQLLSNTVRYAGSSLLAGGLAAFILLPTFAALLVSKATYTVTKVKWQFEYQPYKMLAKFFNGSFNFDQMPNGTPNLFVGSVALITFTAFFLIPKFRPRQRIAAALVTALLAASMMLKPLDLFWHAMQFPIWYPYRFSFIACFWIIWIGNHAFNQLDSLREWMKIVTIAILASGAMLITLNIKRFSNFLTVENVSIGLILMVAAILLVFWVRNTQYSAIAILILVCGEMSYNVFSSLNNISYVTNPNYVNYTQNLKEPVERIQASDSSFYRIGKTFYRTKDDPFEASYNGGDHFSSTFETATPKFFENIGQPDGDGFTEYSNGTMLSDSLLSMKYWLNANNPNPNQYLQALTSKPDLNRYQQLNERNHVQTYQNPFTLPIAFASSNQIFKPITATDPIRYQSDIFNQLLGQSTDRRWFTAINFDSSTFKNLPRQNNLTGAFLQRKNLLKPANMMLTFTPKTNDSYYLTLGSAINLGSSQDSQNVKIYKNGFPLDQYPTYRNTVITNVASKDKGKPITINIELTKSSLLLQNFTLYQFHNQRFASQVKHLQSQSATINNFNSAKLQGRINIKNHQALTTTVPYSKGWHLLINGKTHPIKKWSDMFIGADLTPGKYHFKLYYWPPLLTPGLLITGTTILIIGGYYLVKRRHKRA
ncbi:YfhO family protein [Nicoliella spurrieriana]|uniref:YfhO family protein n=1 Tax=Nicoliella spurrieriana TaxID=2925830 RepID=A0A976RRR1_9LACO|nr:YfhO family protein [Nicoliella spurrieriana]UQS86682.1 YfhO family protein [Nicoliella spurrieriana]